VLCLCAGNFTFHLPHTHTNTHTHKHTPTLNSYTIPPSENLQWNTSLHCILQKQHSALHQNLKARILATFSILWPAKTSSFRNSYRFMQLTRARVLLWHCVVSQWKDHIEYWIWRKRAWISREWNVYRTTSFSSADVQEKHSMKILLFFCKVLKISNKVTKSTLQRFWLPYLQQCDELT